MQSQAKRPSTVQNGFHFSSVLLISFAHLLHDIFSSFLAPILPLLIRKLGLTYTQAGLLSTVQRLPSILNPLLGILAEKVKVRYFLVAGPLITVTSMSLLGTAPYYSVLLVLLFVMGFGTAIFHVPAPAMVRHVAGNRIGKGMSYYMLGGEMARTLGPLTILGAVSLWGLEGTYRLIPFGFVASAILYLKFRTVSIQEDFRKDKPQSTIHHTLKRFTPFFIVIGGYVFFRAVMKSALTLYLPTYLSIKGANLWIAGISLSVLQLSGAAGTFIAGTLSDRIGRKRTLLICGIAAPLSMWCFTLFQNVLMFPILILLGFFIVASGPVILAMVQDTDSEYPAFMNSIFMTINFGISSIMGLLLGAVSDQIGLELTYKICAWVGFASIPFILFLKQPKRA